MGRVSCVTASCHMGGLSWPSRNLAKIGRVLSSTGCVNGTLPNNGNIAGHRPLVGDAPPGWASFGQATPTKTHYATSARVYILYNRMNTLYAVNIANLPDACGARWLLFCLSSQLFRVGSIKGVFQKGSSLSELFHADNSDTCPFCII